MPRESAGLYDRLRATGVVIEPVTNKVALAEETNRLEQQLAEAYVFDIQNVADYFHSFEAKTKSWNETDFPKVAPPFQSYFMEFRFKPYWKQGEVKGSIYAAGVLSYVYDLEKNSSRPPGCPEFDGARWIVESTLFIEDQRKWGNLRAWTRLLSAAQPNGDMVKSHNVNDGVHGGDLPSYLDGRIIDSPEMDQQLRNDIYLIYYPTLLALSFLHCKNVTVQTEDPSPKQSRVFQKKHGRPLIRFHILNIEPMKTVLKNEGQAEKVGLKRALHIVRGHFSDYTERGLFGKHRGIYWFDQHAKGTPEEGVMLKDYNVNTPQSP